MTQPPDPLDMLALDGDGRSIPQLEPDVEDAQRLRWRELNDLDLPSLRPSAYRRREW